MNSDQKTQTDDFPTITKSSPNVRKVNQAWIGYNDIAKEGHWVWANPAGGNHRYTNWNKGEPNNFGNNEDCAAVYKGLNGKWNDVGCNHKFAFVCEIGSGKVRKVITHTGKCCYHRYDISSISSTGEKIDQNHIF